MSKFPLIEEDLGLEVHKCQETMHPGTDGTRYMIDAEPLERLLRQAPVVYGTISGKYFCFDRKEAEVLNTHSARLIGVKPIKNDTAESLLREYVNSDPGDSILKDRALKLLEKKT